MQGSFGLSIIPQLVHGRAGSKARPSEAKCRVLSVASHSKADEQAFSRAAETGQCPPGQHFCTMTTGIQSPPLCSTDQ